MSKFNNKKILPRYKIIAYFIVLVSLAVLAKAAYIGTVKRDYWMAVADRLKKDSVERRTVDGKFSTGVQDVYGLRSGRRT